MIITRSGQVLTNNHVIEGATRIQVTIPGGGQYVARVLGADPTDDVALLQIEGAERTSAPSRWPTRPAVRVADRVVAIGNALGRGGAPRSRRVRSGGSTSRSRCADAHGELDSLDGVIQVQAAVRPGDSGGPLENEHGDVVGMVTAADAHKNGVAVDGRVRHPGRTPRSTSSGASASGDAGTRSSSATPATSGSAWWT